METGLKMALNTLANRLSTLGNWTLAKRPTFLSARDYKHARLPTCKGSIGIAQIVTTRLSVAQLTKGEKIEKQMQNF